MDTYAQSTKSISLENMESKMSKKSFTILPTIYYIMKNLAHRFKVMKKGNLQN